MKYQSDKQKGCGERTKRKARSGVGDSKGGGSNQNILCQRTNSIEVIKTKNKRRNKTALRCRMLWKQQMSTFWGITREDQVKSGGKLYKEMTADNFPNLEEDVNT